MILLSISTVLLVAIFLMDESIMNTKKENPKRDTPKYGIMKKDIGHPKPYSFLHNEDVKSNHLEDGTLSLPIFLKEKWDLAPVKSKQKSTSFPNLNDLGIFDYREDVPPDLVIKDCRKKELRRERTISLGWKHRKSSVRLDDISLPDPESFVCISGQRFT